MAPEQHLERESALLAGVHCVEQAVCQVRQAACAALQECLPQQCRLRQTTAAPAHTESSSAAPPHADNSRPPHAHNSSAASCRHQQRCLLQIISSLNSDLMSIGSLSGLRAGMQTIG